MDFLRVAGAQLNLVVGDLEGNHDRIARAMMWAEEQSADVLLFPELAITGYPPEDLLIRPAFVQANLDVLRRLAALAGDVVSVVGFADRVGPVADPLEDAAVRCVANAAALLYRGEVRGVYRKVLLPNYGVFDEDRYFVPGREPARIWDVGGVPVGVSICEDIWILDGPPTHQAAAGARVLLNINASPYHTVKAEERAALLAAQACRSGVPVVYVNLVGGQDELVFDGGSFVMDGGGAIVQREEEFEEALPLAEFAWNGHILTALPGAVAPELNTDESVYRALVLGIRDYVRKNRFQGVVLGLSGGIDSALTLALAVDALGADKVEAVLMPSRYTAQMSIDDAREEAEILGVSHRTIPIEAAVSAFQGLLTEAFAGLASDATEENIQARCRGVLLMALSNKSGRILLTTGNKSEMSVGYATLYGDMAGGFAPLKDVPKLLVYRLAEYRNRLDPVIPRRVIDRPPSAELRPDQKDEDSLPPYSLLDAILALYVEQDKSIEEIVAAGYPEAEVKRVAGMVDRNEYKRRQAPPGVKITPRAFGRDRRYPITRGRGR